MLKTTFKKYFKCYFLIYYKKRLYYYLIYDILLMAFLRLAQILIYISSAYL